MSEPILLSEVREGVAIIRINRPAKLNAWPMHMGKLYFDMLDAHARDPDVRVILLTGEGRAFCAGADMGGLQELADGAPAADQETRPYWFPLTVAKPIIAAIRGACIGIGLQQALCCDIRFIARDAKIGGPYAKRGLVAELGMSWLLPKIVGLGAAMDMMLSGRLIDGQEAYRIGLAQRLCEADTVFEEAFSYAREIVQHCAPSSLRALKQQLYGDLDGTLPEAYARATVFTDKALVDPAMVEGVQAFTERRAPDFPPLDPARAILPLYQG